MSAQGGAYFANNMTEIFTDGARATRVREFIADSDPDIIADLFALIKDAVINRETQSSFEITEHYRSVNTILNDVMKGLCI